MSACFDDGGKTCLSNKGCPPQDCSFPRNQRRKCAHTSDKVHFVALLDPETPFLAPDRQLPHDIAMYYGLAKSDNVVFGVTSNPDCDRLSGIVREHMSVALTHYNIVLRTSAQDLANMEFVARRTEYCTPIKPNSVGPHASSVPSVVKIETERHCCMVRFGAQLREQLAGSDVLELAGPDALKFDALARIMGENALCIVHTALQEATDGSAFRELHDDCRYIGITNKSADFVTDVLRAAKQQFPEMKNIREYSLLITGGVPTALPENMVFEPTQCTSNLSVRQQHVLKPHQKCRTLNYVTREWEVHFVADHVRVLERSFTLRTRPLIITQPGAVTVKFGATCSTHLHNAEIVVEPRGCCGAAVMDPTGVIVLPHGTIDSITTSPALTEFGWELYDPDCDVGRVDVYDSVLDRWVTSTANTGALGMLEDPDRLPRCVHEA
jgi:hypothetical protein